MNLAVKKSTSGHSRDREARARFRPEDGGSEPLWSRDGRELFFRSGNRMMAVDVTLAPAFSTRTPHVLFEGNYDRIGWGEPTTTFHRMVGAFSCWLPAPPRRRRSAWWSVGAKS